MSKKCEVTGKKSAAGRSYATRGIAKKNKGIGINITGKTKRRFKPNTMKKRFWFPEENRFIKIMVSTAAMRTISKLGISAVVRTMRSEGKKV